MESSSIFGSIRISFTSSGDALNSRLSNIALIPTDLPEPVVPATNRWGIRARSATVGTPEISLPKANVNGDGERSYASDDRTSLSLTISLFSFGISIPTTDFPGITSTTRTLMTAIERARSFAKPVILLTLTPGAG